MIPEHRISGCPQPQVWRKIDEVTDNEREECEERLLSMAEAGMDPRERDQSFWAELNQYIWHTHTSGSSKQGAKCKTQSDDELTRKGSLRSCESNDVWSYEPTR